MAKHRKDTAPPAEIKPVPVTVGAEIVPPPPEGWPLPPDGEWLTIPGNTPDPVLWAILFLAEHSLTPDQIAILKRLARDPRLAPVWRELSRRNRKTGEFCHPARDRKDPPLPPEKAQAVAISETVVNVFLNAARGVQVSKPGEVEEITRELQQQAQWLRRLATDPMFAHQRQALEEKAREIEAGIELRRRPGDPLLIENERGDRALRALTILTADFFLERFGKRLDGCAATLAAVALGKSDVQRRQAARSAFSGRKRQKKTDLSS